MILSKEKVPPQKKADLKKLFKFQTKILWTTTDIRKVINTHPPKNDNPCAFVSPANSYGAMDGGIDDIYSIMFPGPPTIEEVVKDCIRENTIFYNKPLFISRVKSIKPEPVIPVGSGLIVPIPKGEKVMYSDNTFLISVPTMVIPNNVSKSRNAYFSTLAMLKVVEKFNRSKKTRKRVKTIYIPGMCTGCGLMPLEQAVEQMMRAIKDWEERGHPYDNIDELLTPDNVVIFQSLHHRDDIDMSGHKFTLPFQT